MKQLKPESSGIRKDRYTIDEAIENIPVIEKPEDVADIVFQVGLNDARKGSTPEEIQNKMLQMQMAYNQQFPNARQHITALPPLTSRNIEVNKHLQKLCSYTESNFISTKAFIDKASGKLRSGLTNGIHYNNWGVKMIAKEIKKSLYSHANKNNNKINRMRGMLDTEQPINEPETAPVVEPTQSHIA